MNQNILSKEQQQGQVDEHLAACLMHKDHVQQRLPLLSRKSRIAGHGRNIEHQGANATARNLRSGTLADGLVQVFDSLPRHVHKAKLGVLRHLAQVLAQRRKNVPKGLRA